MELPFMSTEKILMEAVKKGESRQEMHEVVKEHSLAAGKVVKEEGLDNDLLQRLADDERLPFSLEDLLDLVGDYGQFTGRASAQTDEYILEVIVPLLAARESQMGEVDSSLSV